MMSSRDEYFEKYSKKHVHFYTGHIPEILSNFLKSSRGSCISSIVDVGCGGGSLLYALKKKGLLEKTSAVYAVDLSSIRLEYVQKMLPDVRIIQSGANNMKLIQDARIDLAISTAVIEHVPSDTDMLREIKRILKVNGHIYMHSYQKKICNLVLSKKG